MLHRIRAGGEVGVAPHTVHQLQGREPAGLAHCGDIAHIGQSNANIPVGPKARRGEPKSRARKESVRIRLSPDCRVAVLSHGATNTRRQRAPTRLGYGLVGPMRQSGRLG